MTPARAHVAGVAARLLARRAPDPPSVPPVPVPSPRYQGSKRRARLARAEARAARNEAALPAHVARLAHLAARIQSAAHFDRILFAASAGQRDALRAVLIAYVPASVRAEIEAADRG